MPRGRAGENGEEDGKGKTGGERERERERGEGEGGRCMDLVN